jgi:signal transduction histidine kinase
LYSLQGLEEQINYLIETKQTERLKELSAGMEKSTQNLTDTLNNLLNWSMSEMGAFPYHPKNTDLKTAVEEVFALFERNAGQKQVNLEVDVPVGLMVYTDENALHTVLRNFVSNAIKFTHPGGEVQVAAALVSDEVHIQVRDTGVGMSPEQVEQWNNGGDISRKAGTNGEKSTGLGLMFSRDLANQNKGSIALESEIKKGTVAKIRLPGKNSSRA